MKAYPPGRLVPPENRLHGAATALLQPSGLAEQLLINLTGRTPPLMGDGRGAVRSQNQSCWGLHRLEFTRLATASGRYKDARSRTSCPRNTSRRTLSSKPGPGSLSRVSHQALERFTMAERAAAKGRRWGVVDALCASGGSVTANSWVMEGWPVLLMATVRGSKLEGVSKSMPLLTLGH